MGIWGASNSWTRRKGVRTSEKGLKRVGFFRNHMMAFGGAKRVENAKFILLRLLHSLTKAIFCSLLRTIYPAISQFRAECEKVVKIFLQHTWKGEQKGRRNPRFWLVCVCLSQGGKNCGKLKHEKVEEKKVFPFGIERTFSLKHLFITRSWHRQSDKKCARSERGK